MISRSRHTFSVLLSVFASLFLTIVAPRALAQCVSLTTMGSASTQSFDTLSNTAGSTTNNLTIPGWFLTESGGGARDNEQYAVDTGGSTTGDMYSYGAAGNTERALGQLRSGTLIPLFGACFTNNTGATIQSLDIAYIGEQWRIGNTAAARDDRMDFQYSLNATDLTTGAWTDVNALDFTNPIKTNASAGALDGNAAANRTAISQSIPALSIANGATFWIRWNDIDASGADDGLAIDSFSLTPQGGVGVPTLNINDVSIAEGNAGTTMFTFSVTLTAPAGAGGVTFDITTADGTAQDDNPAVSEDNDYVANSLTGQTIPTGSTGPYNFSVLVNGDTTTEANETFFVNVTNIVGANAGDTQGQGTISNDDVTVTAIHDVQGNGASSPIVGATVTIRGIVTGVKSNGFFVQEEDADVDADPATSEGVFVFTSSAPPAAAAFTAQVQVTGTVVEFVPSSDTQQPPLTEIGGSPTVTQLAAPGQPLPAAVALSATFPDPAGPYDQLERVEGMRVSASSITVTAPSDGSISEPNNTGTSNGRFHGVITGVARPFREPGIQHPDVPPSGTIPPIPRWDTNPELLRIESATINAQPILTVKTGDTVAPVVGPLDYGFRGYAIYPDGTLSATVTPGTLPTTATAPAGQEFTVASLNIFHFYDTTNDGATSDVVLTAAAYNNRLNKASIAIRNNLQMPDILGLQEVENLTVLQDLATKINNDAVANSQPNPQYVAYLSEGNDVGGIDVGFLVKTADVGGGTPRVEVNSVTQIGAATTWIDPDDNTPALLNDRPSLVLDAIVHRSASTSYPVVVINNHLRSLIGIDSNAPDGLTTEGDRVRRKRQAQAEFLANYLQGRLTTNATENIVLVGDFNAFEFNDGYSDPVNVFSGTPAPDNETVVPGDGVDLVNPDFTNLVNTPPPAERYSYLHDGNAQNIDHAIVSAGLVASTTARRIEHPRINTDYPETERGNSASPLRLSDHDPVVAYFTVGAFASADVSITKTDLADPVTAGSNVAYGITVQNAGPDMVGPVSWSDTLPAGTTFVSLTAAGGWSCTTPAIGANGTITCSIASLGVTTDAFSLLANVNADVAAGTVLSNTATLTAASDSTPGNNSATATTTVATSADLLLSKTDSPDPATAGTNISYTITITNNGPSNAANATFSDTLPAGTTFVSLSTTGPWSCTTPAVGATGTVTCTNTSFGVTVDFFTLVVAVDPNLATGTVLSNTATLSSSTTDPNSANNSATATTTVTTSADLSVTKTDAPDPVTAGSNLTYTITVTNNGSSNASTVQLTDTVPTGTTFVSLSSPGGWSCSTPAVGGTGTITCSIASMPPTGSAAFTLVVATSAALANGTIITNTASVSTVTTDPNAGNNTATATTTVGGGSADLAIVKTDVPDPVTAGTNLSYSIDVTNNGPSNASNASWTDTLPAGTTFVSLMSPAGWSCTTPAVGAAGTITCTNASFIPGTSSFFLVVAVDGALANGTVLSNTATVTAATSDSSLGNNSSTTATTVSSLADLSVTKTDAPDPVLAGANITYTLTVTNNGPSFASAAQLTDTLPSGTTFVSLSSPAGWSCTTPAVGAGGTVTCSNTSLAVGNSVFTLVVATSAGLSNGTVITNTASASTTSTDGDPSNNTASTTTTVQTAASITGTKSVSGSLMPGGAITYTIVLTNNGGSIQQDNAGNEFIDVLPASLTLVSASATSGSAVATVGTNTVTWNGVINPGSSVTITINATIDSDVPPGTTVSNQGTINYDANGDGTNEATRSTDSTSQGGSADPTTFVVGAAADPTPVPTLDEWALIVFAALLGMAALVAMKRS
jgi:uncharacterized repeat protein (TIGR01451 family)